MKYFQRPDGTVVSYSNEVIRKSDLKDVIVYDDYIKVQKTEKKQVDDNIYRTLENGEVELILEWKKEIDVPIFKKEKIKKPVLEIDWFDDEWNEKFVKKEKIEIVDIPVMEIKKVEKRIDPNWTTTIIDDDYLEITEKDFYKILRSRKETQSEKEIDRKEAQEIIYNKKYFVNITTENDRKVAVVHDASTADQNVEIEYDPERWDKFFDTIDEAKKYAEEINSAK